MSLEKKLSKEVLEAMPTQKGFEEWCAKQGVEYPIFTKKHIDYLRKIMDEYTMNENLTKMNGSLFKEKESIYKRIKKYLGGN